MPCDVRPPNRPTPTWRQIINPIWLLGDDLRPPGWGWWAHFWRNPAINLALSVIGLGARTRFVWWRRGPGWTFVPVGGWNWGASLPEGGWIPRPFLSFRGKRWERSIGWKTSGAFSITWRRANSPNQEERP